MFLAKMMKKIVFVLACSFLFAVSNNTSHAIKTEEFYDDTNIAALQEAFDYEKEGDFGAANANYHRLIRDMSDPIAMYNYGLNLIKGKGIEKDEKEGIRYIKKASELDLDAAHFFMATLYQKGIYFKKDIDTAIKYAIKAKLDGYQGSDELIFALNEEKNRNSSGKASAVDQIELRADSKNKSVAVKPTWEEYSNRKKNITEEVLNYTTTGSLDGIHSMWWEIQNGNKCKLKVVGSEVDNPNILGSPAQRFGVTEIIINNINETGFNIKNEYNSRREFYKNLWIISDGTKEYFRIPHRSLTLTRLRKAWNLALKECPGEKSRF